jgi:Fur family ferric uptake transcriptional regulator
VPNPNDLRNSGLKATLPRIRILELFERSSVRHLSAEDIYRSLSRDGIDVGLATIYRVLTQFEQAGLLQRHRFESDKAVFELNDSNHHDHLVCLDCGRVEEFVDEDIETRQSAIAAERGFQIRAHSLYLYARCTRGGCPWRSNAEAAPQVEGPEA